MNYIPIASSTPITISAEKNRQIKLVLERVMNRLRIKKGSFVLDKNLGSELYKLAGTKASQMLTHATAYIKEALAPIAEVTVLDVSLEQHSDILEITVYLKIEDIKTSVTVSV